MNPWDISIGNLLRKRPEPEDEPEKECRTCHMQKPLTAFYQRFNEKDEPYYSARCKECVCKRDNRARKSPTASGTVRVLDAIQAGDMTRRELSAHLGFSARTVQRHTAALKADGKIHITEYRIDPASSVEAAVYRFGKGKDALAPSSHWHYTTIRRQKNLPVKNVDADVFSMAGLLQIEQVQGEGK